MVTEIVMLLLRTVSISILSMLLILAIFIGYHRIQVGLCRRRHSHRGKIIAFFHPYCSSGGGGERVLWKMISVLQDLHQRGILIHKVIIYTIDPISNNYKDNLLQNVKERFAIPMLCQNNNTAETTTSKQGQQQQLDIEFIHLPDYRYLLEPVSTFSLLMESIGSMKLAYIALCKSLLSEQTSNSSCCVPDIFIDTMGCSFTYLPAYLLFGCTVIAYVHYPTISTDMLQVVWERRRSTTSSSLYNHSVVISQSILKTYIKLLYYILFAILYGCIGSLCCSVVLVNSTWTYNHIASLWIGARKRITIVFPPCNVQNLLPPNAQLTSTTKSEITRRIPAIVSIGQFRPEKDHQLQLEAFAKLLELYPSYQSTNKNDDNAVQLILIGSCRDENDTKRLQILKELAIQLKIQNRVQFIVNQPYNVIQEWLSKGSIGIHTMWNEHFGIGIVEMMAAGLLTIAHNSGGPKLDIIKDGETGFLACTVTEYATCIHTALGMVSSNQDGTMRKKAQESSLRFSDEVFATSFQNVLLDSKVLL